MDIQKAVDEINNRHEIEKEAQELAKKLDVTQAYISKIENQKVVSPKFLKKVNDVLNFINKK